MCIYIYRETHTHTSEAALWGLEFLEELLVSVHPRRDRALPPQNRTDLAAAWKVKKYMWTGEGMRWTRGGTEASGQRSSSKLWQPFLN